MMDGNEKDHVHCEEEEEEDIIENIMLTVFEAFVSAYEDLDKYTETMTTPNNAPLINSNLPPPPIGLISISSLIDIHIFLELFIAYVLIPILPPIASLSEHKPTSSVVLKRLGVKGIEVIKAGGGDLLRSRRRKRLITNLLPSSRQQDITPQDGKDILLVTSVFIPPLQRVISVMSRFLKNPRFAGMFANRFARDIISAAIALDVYEMAKIKAEESGSEYKDNSDACSISSIIRSMSNVDVVIFGVARNSSMNNGDSDYEDNSEHADGGILTYHTSAIGVNELMLRMRMNGKRKVPVESTSPSPFFSLPIEETFSIAFNIICASLLSHIAGRSLSSVLDLFVISQNDNSQGEKDNEKSSTAAARLAMALSLPPKDLLSNNSSSSDVLINRHFQRICRQLLKAVGQCSPDKGRSDAGVLTAAATAVALPKDVADTYFFKPLLCDCSKTTITTTTQENYDDNIIEDARPLATLLLSGPLTLSLINRIGGVKTLSKVMRGAITTANSYLNYGAEGDIQRGEGWEKVIIAVIVRHSGISPVVPLILLRAVGLVGGYPGTAGYSDTTMEVAAQLLLEIIIKDQSFDVGSFFVTVLRLYLKYIAPTASFNVIRSETKLDLMAAMTILPLLCEKCELDKILSGSTVLSIIKAIIVIAGGEAAYVQVEAIDFGDLGERIAANSMPTDSSVSNTHEDPLESIQSLTSITLSLLIGLLELGNKRRDPDEENILQSLKSSLTILATFRENGNAEIAEMSSHALALIVSRACSEASVSKINVSYEENVNTSLEELLKSASTDLDSSSPPIRARGVAGLTHLVRGVVEKRSNLNKKSGIEILDSDEDKEEYENKRTRHSKSLVLKDDVVERLVKVILKAMGDEESYVYLAAISTLTVLADEHVDFGMNVMARGVGRGRLTLCGDIINLSMSVRAKMAESLNFAIRRRSCGTGNSVFGGCSLNENIAMQIVEELTMGARGSAQKKIQSHDRKQEIESGTHKYFVDIDEEYTASRVEEQKLRVNTGGPVYSIEEDEVIRASSLSCLYELVINLNTSVLERHIYLFMDICIQALRLDCSRSIRRAAGLLARGLYARANADTEIHGLVGSSLCVAMCLGNGAQEETLTEALKAAVGGGWGGGEKQCDRRFLGDGGTFHDEAVKARSQEALSLREGLENAGVWKWAREMGHDSRRKNSAVKAVEKLLNVAKHEQLTDGMKKFTIDNNSLRFL